jgi:hypothetical protein
LFITKASSIRNIPPMPVDVVPPFFSLPKLDNFRYKQMVYKQKASHTRSTFWFLHTILLCPSLWTNFILTFKGRLVYVYLSEKTHVPVELDWFYFHFHGETRACLFIYSILLLLGFRRRLIRQQIMMSQKLSSTICKRFRILFFGRYIITAYHWMWQCRPDKRMLTVQL